MVQIITTFKLLFDQDVAQQLQMELLEVRESVQALQKRRGVTTSGSVSHDNDSGVEDEVLDELARIVEFVHQGGRQGDGDAEDALVAASVSEGRTGGGGGGNVLHFSALERLSFAMFAVDHLAVLVGMPREDVEAQRRQALACCDLGLRLEQAFDFASALTARLGVRLALAGIQLD